MLSISVGQLVSDEAPRSRLQTQPVGLFIFFAQLDRHRLSSRSRGMSGHILISNIAVRIIATATRYIRGSFHPFEYFSIYLSSSAECSPMPWQGRDIFTLFIVGYSA
jgi:hypothetical protein